MEKEKGKTSGKMVELLCAELTSLKLPSALVLLLSTRLGMRKAGKVTVVPWIKHPKLTANTANT